MSTENSMDTLSGFRALLRSQDAALAIALVVIIGLMIVPLPPIVVDLLVALNLALSVGILLIGMYISKPMEFSVFPTTLLLVTLLRLGINISASRLILLNGDAGKVIEGFGDLIIGGNYVVGIVIFLMLMIIQFTVITNGAGRVAEVAARFTLDAMPGKQLAIDADLNAGLIDEDEARQRRRIIETEADFYGAMDGASKFVRGDAVAGIAVVLVNIFGGFVIGVLLRGLPAMEALRDYTLLTVGAGLAIQIPALLVSTAAGLIVTRSTTEASLGTDMLSQFSNVSALLASTVIISSLVLVPGLPKFPFLMIGGALAGATFVAWRAQVQKAQTPEPETPDLEAPQDILGMLVIDPIELEIGYGLIPLVGDERADNLLHRVTAIRRQIASELGLVLPMVRIRDNLRLSPSAYRIKIRGEEVASGDLMLDRFLAIPGSSSDETLPGVNTTEPAFGLPAVWINEAEKGRAELLEYTVVDPLSVLSTHLTEIARSYAPDLLGRQEVQEILDRIQREMPAVLDGLIPDILNLGEIQAVLHNLLRERIPIRDLAGILEVLATHGTMTRDPNILMEAVRQNLARTISNLYRDHERSLHVFTIAPELEANLKQSLTSENGQLGFQIDPRFAQSILNNTGVQMERLAQTGHQPILLCPREIRLAFRRLVERTLPNLTVLAFSEVSQGTKVKGYGMIEFPQPLLTPSAGASS